MIRQGQASDTLRALGRFLEFVGAAEITIDDRGEGLDVEWQGREGHIGRNLDQLDADALRKAALFFRGTGAWSPVFGIAAFLRTIGQELDGRYAQQITVAETIDGFWASG